jgi:ribosome-associated protein
VARRTEPRDLRPGHLRPSAQRLEDGEHATSASVEQAETPDRPSRSARKRHAIALQRLGVRLTLLPPARLSQLELPEELLAAVLEAQRLRSRAAIARQRQYIGRLMRALDPAPIEQALARLGRPAQRQC